MPPRKASPDTDKAPAIRGKAFNIRIDDTLFEAAKDKARGVGLGPVIRALLKAYIRGDVEPAQQDLDSELTTAPKGPKRRRPAKD